MDEKKPTLTAMRCKAQELLMEQMSRASCGPDYEEFVKFCGDECLAEDMIQAQIDKITQMFGHRRVYHILKGKTCPNKD